MTPLGLSFDLDDERIPAWIGGKICENGPHSLNGSANLHFRPDLVHLG
jgi:hypothetical protein